MPSDEEIRSVLKEMKSAAGVGHSVESLEVFLLFPDEFRRNYAELVARALKGAVEDQAGRTLERESGVGRAQVSSKYKGKRVGAGAGGAGKRYKKFWTVRDENALEVKAKIDRRLRALSRDIVRMLEVREGLAVDAAKVTTSMKCADCGRFCEVGWKYCPGCGEQVRLDVRSRARRSGVEE